MVIKASTASDVRQLIDALGGADDVARETAVARLSIIGGRAITRLVTAYNAAESRRTRIAVLRVLESIGDSRAMPVATRALDEGGDVAVAATGILRVLLDSHEGSVGTAALDRLVAVALDPSRHRRLRVAACDALRSVPGGAHERVLQALAADTSPADGAHVAAPPLDGRTLDALWQDAAGGVLPDTPADLREAARAKGPTAPLGLLQGLVDLVRAKEGSTAAPRRAEWQALRGALHQTLALRGSRVAVYDLRETLEDAPGPVPASFLAALHAVGDESCLDALAAAYTRATDAHWRHQLAETFRAIARRERIGARSVAVKKIVSKWPAAADLVRRSPT